MYVVNADSCSIPQEQGLAEVASASDSKTMWCHTSSFGLI